MPTEKGQGEQQGEQGGLEREGERGGGLWQQQQGKQWQQLG